jgi:hypothetical protein
VIVSYAGDDTVRAVAALGALRDLPIVRWSVTDFPTEQVQSWRIGASTELRVRGKYIDEDIADGTIRAVWLRRARPPHIADAPIHPDDRHFVTLSSRAYHSALWHQLVDLLPEPEVCWINAFPASRRAESKLVQLSLARDIGLRIPETIVTNDPQDAVVFFRDVPFIRKDFLPYVWSLPRGSYSNLTTLVDPETLVASAAARTYAAIYQEAIAKAYEVRVTVIGDFVSAVTIHSQGDPKTQTDYRAARPTAGGLAPFDLPGDIEEGIRHLVRRLALKFCTIDLIVGPDGGFTFLEVNQQGQFLWIDQAIPQSFLLEAFVELLDQGQLPSTWRPRRGSLHLDEVEAHPVMTEFEEQDREMPDFKYPRHDY